MDPDLIPLEWHTETRVVSSLAPFEHNPRILTEKQAEDLRHSLERFNLVEIPAVNTNNMIVAGHQRLKIMEMLGRGKETIEVRVPNRALTDEEFREYLVRSNKNTGEWNWDVLANAFDTDKLLEWGFTEEELDIATPIEEADDNVPPIDNTPAVTAPGDVYEFTFGKLTNRIACGDCLDLELVKKLMAGKEADMVFTDPPWNVGLGTNEDSDKAQGKLSRPIQNDQMDTEAFVQFLRDSFTSTASVLKPGGMVYVVMSAQEWGSIMQAMKECGYHWSSTIIWVKDALILSRKDYHTQFEPIWYGWKDGEARLHPLLDRKQSDVWTIDRPKNSESHPTMKPIELVARAVTNSSNPSAMVTDFFSGSGSTAVACARTKRNFCGIELEPKYVDVIVRRLIEFMEANAIVFNLKRNEENIDQSQFKKA